MGVSARVEFVGVVTDSAPVYREMDIFVLTSDTEQMPLTLLEAMATGLPVVSTDVGDVRQMLAEPNHPFLSPRRDAATLATHIDRLVEDASLRRRVGAENRRRCEVAYDKDSCYGAWIERYEKLLSAGV